jgi:hypothetical protein
MRVIPPMLAGLTALAAPSVQAAPNPNENWRPLNPPLSLSLGDQACTMVGIKPLGRLARRLVVGVRACPIDDLVPLGGRLNGLGA